MTALAGRPGTRVLAWSLAGLGPLVMAGALVLLPFNARAMSPSRIGIYAFAMVAVVVYAGIGGLIAARIPRNPIGWLLCLTGLALAVSLFLEQYGLRGLATAAWPPRPGRCQRSGRSPRSATARSSWRSCR